MGQSQTRTHTTPESIRKISRRIRRLQSIQLILFMCGDSAIILWIFWAKNCSKTNSHQRWLLFIFDESQFISSSIIRVFTRSRLSPSPSHCHRSHLILIPPETNILLFHLPYLRLNVLVHDFVITGNTHTHTQTQAHNARETTCTKFDIMTQKSPLCLSCECLRYYNRISMYYIFILHLQTMIESEKSSTERGRRMLMI